MNVSEREEKELIVFFPFEISDIQLALKAVNAGAFGILRLEKNNEITRELITTISEKTGTPFGIVVAHSTVIDFALPKNVTKIIIPFGYNLKIKTQAEILCQVNSIKEAEEVLAQKAYSIVIKGNDSYDIFRSIINQSQKNKVKVYIQSDDTGIHSSAAFLALGAQGIIFDSQTALFPECKHSVPEGQNLSLAEDLVENYKNLRNFTYSFFEAAYGHIRQAKNLDIISCDNCSETVEIEHKEQEGSFSKILIWEKQMNKAMQKDKNLSKFSLVFSNDVIDAFFAAFVSIMAAPASVKGIKICISSQKDVASKEKYFDEKLQSDTQKLLSGLEDITSSVMPDATPLDIAVVGMDCIYPDAANVDEYWKNILTAKDCVSEIPASHWDKDELYKPNTTDTDYLFSKWGGFIPTIDFDPVDFGIMPQSLFKTEPSHLLSLLVAKRALKDAGYDNLAECDFENTSIFMGTNGSGTSMLSKAYARWTAKQIYGDVPEELSDDFPRFNEFTFPGFLPNILAGRIANRLNFGGRNYTVDAACASSLAALDIACQELSSGRSDMVVMGGADLENTLVSYLMFSSMRILTSKAYCAPFDASADGIIMGEGIGIVILKRLEDAERDGNKIYAVIKGIGGSSDGRNMSVTAPSRKGETRALERAYQSAGIFPSQAGMIEAHGTGTVVGDKVELSTLTNLFVNSGALPNQTFIGSVKSQIGHTKCAAGIGGLIKAILSVYHGIIPPTIHIDRTNPFYNQQTSPFVFNRQAGLWNSDKRIAGVSAFGFGGTNFHTIIENYQPNIPEEESLKVWPSELFVFRGDTLDEAKILLQKVKSLISINNSLRLADIAYSLALYNDKKIQVSFVVGSIDELLMKINAVLEDRIEFKIYHRNVKEGKIAFLFPGEGSQYVNMARELFIAFPHIRRLLYKHSEYICALFPEATFDEETKEAQKKTITDTNNAQPILGIVNLAIAEYLRFLGITPDVLAGHGCGELSALCFSGVISPDDLIAVSQARAKAINAALENDRGKLIAAIAGEEEIKPLLEGESEVWTVNYNSPKQIVLAGTTQGAKAFMKKAAGKNIFCREINVDCALHSPLLAKAEKLFTDAIKDFDFKSQEIPVISNMTAGEYPKESDAIKKHIGKHLDTPIKFIRQIENMYDAGVRIFIETGPGRVLLGLVESILGKNALTIQTDNKSSEGLSYLLRALGQYLSTGNSFHIERLFEGRKVTFLHIDEPEQYKKSPTGWLINGNEVYPSNENKLVETKKQTQEKMPVSVSPVENL